MDPVDRITPPVTIGDRLVLRTLLPDGSATDVIGWVAQLGEDQVTVDGLHSRSSVQRARVVAARRLPAALGGPGPLRTSPAELEQISLPGWVAHTEPLGDWTLRAGGGFTRRANSCLAVGDPGMPIAEAADRVVGFAAANLIPPRVQVVSGSEVERQLKALGWHEVYVSTDVLGIRLVDLLGDRRPHPDVEVTTSLERSWEVAYRVSRPTDADPEVVRSILDGQPPRAFGQVRVDGDVIAIGRGQVNRAWLGLAAIWTAPSHRGRGWSTQLMVALGHWAARQGARNAYLQVASENRAAHDAYLRAGFVLHHSYRYLAPT